MLTIAKNRCIPASAPDAQSRPSAVVFGELAGQFQGQSRHRDNRADIPEALNDLSPSPAEHSVRDRKVAGLNPGSTLHR